MEQSTSQGWQQQWSPQPQQTQQQPPGAFTHFLSPGHQQTYAFQQQSSQSAQSSQSSTPNGVQYGQQFQSYAMYQPQGTHQIQQQVTPPIPDENLERLLADMMQEGYTTDQIEHDPQQHAATQAQSQQILSPQAYQQYMASLSSTATKDSYMNILHPAYTSPPHPQPQASTSHIQAQQHYQLPEGQAAHYGQLPSGYAYPFAIGNGTDQSWGTFALDDPVTGDDMILDSNLSLSTTPNPSFVSPLPQQQPPQAGQHTISPEMLHPRPQLATPRTIQLPDALSPQTPGHPQGSATIASPPITTGVPFRPRQPTKPSTSSFSPAHNGPSGLDPLLSPEKLDQQPSQIAHALLTQLTGKKTEPPDLDTRLKVLRALREHAPERFWKVWAKESLAVEMLKGWLDDAVGEEKPRAEVMMPLLQVIERLPIPIDILRSTKIGQSIRRAVKASPTTAIKDVAQKLETRWKDEVTKLLAVPNKTPDKESTPVGDGAKKRSAISVEDARKKRKVEQPVASTSRTSAAAPVKKSLTPPVKVAAKPLGKLTAAGTATVKAATVDSGFFSTSKPKAKLPSFRKTSVIGPAASVKQDGPTAEKPKVPVNTADAFQEALKSLNKKNGIGEKSTPPSPLDGTLDTERDGSAAPPEPSNPLKKKKSVSFAAGEALLKVKIIEPAVYDDDEHLGEHHNSARDLDRAEGLALAQAIFDEEIDWYEPCELEFPSEPPDICFDRGGSSQEKATQDAREHGVDEVSYDTLEMVPKSPAEPGNIPPGVPDDTNIPRLKLPNGMEAITPAGDPDAESTPKEPVPNVAELLKKLSREAVPAFQPTTSQAPPSSTLAQLGIDPSQIASILAHVPQAGQPGGVSNQPAYNGDRAWAPGGPQGTNAGWSDDGNNWSQGDLNGFNRGPSDQSWASRVRGGKGKGGRGGGGRVGGKHKQIPCQFYQQGRCRYGEDCDFLHVDA